MEFTHTRAVLPGRTQIDSSMCLIAVPPRVLDGFPGAKLCVPN